MGRIEEIISVTREIAALLLNILDYPDPQAAIDAAMDGDRVYFPGTRVYEAPSGGWIISKSLELFGDGPGAPDAISGSVLRPFSGPSEDVDNHIFRLSPVNGTDGTTQLYIHDLRLTGSLGTSSPGDGLRFYADGLIQLSELILRRLWIDSLNGAGVRFIGMNGGKDAINKPLPTLVWVKGVIGTA